ncbi:MAG: recombination mediator RecR [Bacteroidota bacterium]
MNFSSKLIEDAVDSLATLPSIGRKTALRLVLHLINQDKMATEQITSALTNLRNNIQHCQICNNISDEKICSICKDLRRHRHTICVVESIRDVLAIESTGQYRGLYHVLGGVISPIEGIGPNELAIDSLIGRAADEEVKEIILAISPTIEGDTTAFYISKKLRGQNIKISTIARGISFGGELEYADELTLGRSIMARTPYQLMKE